jgi:hypothetical protein
MKRSDFYLSISEVGDFYGIAPKKNRFCGGFSHDRPDFGCTAVQRDMTLNYFSHIIRGADFI